MRNPDKAKVLETQNLAVGYGTKTVVAEINQEVLKGQFVSLLGPNGSGKTTILRSFARLLAPLNGVIYLNGHILGSLKSDELARSLSVVLTERPSPGLMTTFEFVAMGRYPYTGFLGRLSEKDMQKTEEALRLVNAEHIADRYFNELSDGERQKGLLARALAQEPEVIILDEPTLHLDLKHRIELIAILRNFCREKGITVIVSLHDVDLALKVSDVVVLVKNGGIMACGSPDEILKEDTVTKLYDLDCACFNSRLGTIELMNNSNSNMIFVIAGAGTGTAVYRFLSRNGFSIVTGVIHENDIDYHIALSVGAAVIGENPFEEVQDRTCQKAMSFIAEIDRVIDTGFPIGPVNKRNIELLLSALDQEKDVFTMRSKEDASILFGAAAKNLIHCKDLQGIVS